MLPFRKMCGIHWQMSAKSSMMWNGRPPEAKSGRKTRKTTTQALGGPIFAEWAALSEQCDGLLAQIDRLSFWLECLWEAVELVDWRCGEDPYSGHQPMAGRRKSERDPATGPSAHSEVGGTPENQLPEMLTFLDGIAQPLADWASAGGTAFPGSCRSCLLSGQRGPFLAAGACRGGTMAMRSSAKPLWKLSNGWRSGSKTIHPSRGWLKPS